MPEVVESLVGEARVSEMPTERPCHSRSVQRTTIAARESEISIVPHPIGATPIDREGDHVQDYVAAIEDLLSDLFKRADECTAAREQTCLTSAFEDASLRVSQITTPDLSEDRAATHTELEADLAAMLEIHRMAEVLANPTNTFMQASTEAVDALGRAIERWSDVVAVE